jgi:hypothetical protein
MAKQKTQLERITAYLTTCGQTAYVDAGRIPADVTRRFNSVRDAITLVKKCEHPMYFRLKASGELAYSSATVPTRYPYVLEIIHNGADWQETVHHFELYRRDGTLVRRAKQNAYCGYDRGPKNIMLIVAMLQEVQ